MNIISNKTYTDVKVEEYEQNGWNFIFTKAGMYNTSDLDMLQDALTLQGIPDITNGNNCALIYNKQFNFGFFVNPKDSLYLCNYEQRQQNYIDIKNQFRTNKINYISIIPEQAQLKHSNAWKQKQNEDIKILDKISDTFYCTPYKGTIVDANQIQYQFQRFKNMDGVKGKSIFENQLNENVIKTELEYLTHIFKNQSLQFYCEYTEEEIPLNNLTQENPIKWASYITLYEDELGDNGLVTCEFRFRVMGDCFFGLIRNYLRVDDVLIRILDTRIYHQFGWDYILRDFTHREESWQNIQKNGFHFSPQWSTDQNQSFLIQNSVPVQLHINDKIYFQFG
ncbi:unnamed protein product [Paramecium sonneborni]|uniref:TIP41-like protein n=1 Tax=Paramecium sonneborni TaxID=65129 RepID=A0A8S1K3E1_9CILI|nr:unnamed protein product [Paramecium sonneborni]